MNKLIKYTSICISFFLVACAHTPKASDSNFMGEYSNYLDGGTFVTASKVNEEIFVQFDDEAKLKALPITKMYRFFLGELFAWDKKATEKLDCIFFDNTFIKESSEEYGMSYHTLEELTEEDMKRQNTEPFEERFIGEFWVNPVKNKVFICKGDVTTLNKMMWLEKNESGYFYYDYISGLREVYRK